MCFFCTILFAVLPLHLRAQRRQKYYDQRKDGLGERSRRQQSLPLASAGRPEERASLLLCGDKSRALTSSLSSPGSRKCCAKCFSNKSLEKNKHSNPLMSWLIPHLGFGFSKEPHAPLPPGPGPLRSNPPAASAPIQGAHWDPIQLPCVLLRGPTDQRLFQG